MSPLLAELSSTGQLILEIAQAIIAAVIGYFMWRARQQAKAAAAEVKEVKETLADTTEETRSNLADIKNTGEATYHLSNSAMEEQKRLLAVTARALANTEPTPVNLAAANVAEEAYEKHKTKQDAINVSGLPLPPAEG